MMLLVFVATLSKRVASSERCKRRRALPPDSMKARKREIEHFARLTASVEFYLVIRCLYLPITASEATTSVRAQIAAVTKVYLLKEA
jgi:hypothetical protein